MNKIYIVIGLMIALFFGLKIADSLHTEKIYDVKIIDTQQQQIISGSNDNIKTSIRYLIITDKGTFICKSNFWQGKFNNSDIFFHLKKDSVYNEFKVSGFGNGLLFDYQNILGVY